MLRIRLFALLGLLLLWAPLPAAAQFRGPSSMPTIQDADPGVDHTARDADLPPEERRTSVFYRTEYPPGTIIVNTADRFLYLIMGNNTRAALRHRRRPRRLPVGRHPQDHAARRNGRTGRRRRK